MNWFYHLKTARKLALGFGICLSLAMGVGGVAISHMANLDTISKDIVSGSVEGLLALDNANAGIRQYHLAQYQDVLASSPTDMRLAETDMSTQKGLADAALKSYLTTIQDRQNLKNCTALQTEWQKYTAMTHALLVFSHKNQDRQSVALLNGPMKTQFFRVRDALNTMVVWNAKHGADYSSEAQAAYSSAWTVIVGLLALTVLIGIAVSIVITRYITGAMTQVSERLDRLQQVCITGLGDAIVAMEHGDLTVGVVASTQPIDVSTRDEFGLLAATFNRVLAQTQAMIGSFANSQNSLCLLVTQLQSTAGQVNTAAEALAGTSQQIGAATEEITATMLEVAQASEQSARGASEVAAGSATQAASISEGADLVKQLADAIRSVATDSGTAEQAAVEATHATQAGSASVRETVVGMHAIQRTIAESAQIIQTLGASSKQIGTIVQTIEEIADQTNLLALNAAIEAARAGDAGRGFAVVADEVRKLAERSRGATEEIGDLIETVQSQTKKAVSAMEGGVREVEAKTALAERAGEALTQIEVVVASVTERIHNICTAAEEMTAASDEVSRAMSDVAAVVEESSAAAEEMSASAEQVSASVATVAGTTTQQSVAVEDLVAAASDLSDVSLALSELTARFKVDGNTATETAPALTLKKAA